MKPCRIFFIRFINGGGHFSRDFIHAMCNHYIHPLVTYGEMLQKSTVACKSSFKLWLIVRNFGERKSSFS